MDKALTPESSCRFEGRGEIVQHCQSPHSAGIRAKSWEHDALQQTVQCL